MCGGGSTTNSNQTTTQKKWTGDYAATAKDGIASLSGYFANSTPKADAISAYNNGTFSTPLNPLQTASYDRNAALMGNSEINNIASGSGLDLENNATFQKGLQSKIDRSTKAFGTSLDSVNGSFQRGGTADSSMRYRKGQNMLEDQSENVNDMVTSAYASEEDRQINKMMQANSLLNQAGDQGYKYQAAMQAIKDGSLANAMKIYGLDAADKQQQMQFLQLISEPSQTTNGTSTTQRQLGIADLAGMFF